MKIETDDYTVKVLDSPKTKEKVWNMLIEWFEERERFNAESVGQDEDCQIYAVDLLGDIADEIFVQYWKDE